jgi:hypothetical protein
MNVDYGIVVGTRWGSCVDAIVTRIDSDHRGRSLTDIYVSNNTGRIDALICAVYGKVSVKNRCEIVSQNGWFGSSVTIDDTVYHHGSSFPAEFVCFPLKTNNSKPKYISIFHVSPLLEDPQLVRIEVIQSWSGNNHANSHKSQYSGPNLILPILHQAVLSNHHSSDPAINAAKLLLDHYSPPQAIELVITGKSHPKHKPPLFFTTDQADCLVNFDLPSP